MQKYISYLERHAVRVTFGKQRLLVGSQVLGAWSSSLMEHWTLLHGYIESAMRDAIRKIYLNVSRTRNLYDFVAGISQDTRQKKKLVILLLAYYLFR